jgi:hypothetical protein
MWRRSVRRVLEETEMLTEWKEKMEKDGWKEK